MGGSDYNQLINDITMTHIPQYIILPPIQGRVWGGVLNLEMEVRETREYKRWPPSQTLLSQIQIVL